MARIRIPTRTTTRELPDSPNALPGVRMTAAPDARDLGGGRSQIANAEARQTLGNALDHFESAVGLIEKRRDHTAVMSTLAQAQRETARMQAEMQARKGQFAEGVTEDTSRWFDEQYEKIAGGLRNDRQRRAFDDEWQRLRVNAEVAASRHEVVEGRNAMIAASTATVQGAIELAAAAPHDPVALADYRDQLVIASRNAAAAAGHKSDSTAAQLEVIKNLSALHEAVGTALLADDPAAAADYVKRFAGEMNASTFDRMQRTVETGKRLRLAQSFADEVTSAGMTEAEAIAEARKRFDGEDERDAVTEVKARFSEQSVARERQQREAADQAWQILMDTGSMTNVPPHLIAVMDGRDVAAMRRHVTQQIESRARTADAAASRAYAEENRAWTREQRGLARQTRAQAEAYERARMMAVTDPEAFARQNWRQHNDKLSYEQIQSLRKMQEVKPVADFLTYSQQLSRATASMDKEKSAIFMMNADAAMQRFIDANGREPTQKERGEIISSMEVEFKREIPFWPDSTIRRGQVTPDNRNRVYIPGMEDLPRPAVEAVIGGVPPDKIKDLISRYPKGRELDADLLIKQYLYENSK